MAYLKFSVKVIPLRMACKRRYDGSSKFGKDNRWCTSANCFFSLRMFSGGDDETDTPFLSGRAFDTDKQSLRSVESEALF